MDEINFSGREQALIDRGYSPETVLHLSRCDPGEMERQARRIFDWLSRDCVPMERPVCHYLGGQPGAGKSVYSRRLQEETPETYVEIGIDTYRTWHPRYREMEGEIRRHWADRRVTEDDSPGNDIADFTHGFAGIVTDLLIDRAIAGGYPMILEWGMRNPQEPLERLEQMAALGYRNRVRFIGTDAGTSLAACHMRSDIMAESGHIVRRISGVFHALAVSTLPASCAAIWHRGSRWCDSFCVADRRGNLIWTPESEEDPEAAYAATLHGPAHDPWNAPHEAVLSLYNELAGLHDER